MRCYFTAICALSVIISGFAKEDPTFWRRQARNDIFSQLNTPFNTNVAKNVILFIGDGMGISTITAARILKGQLKNKSGEETVLSFEKFPFSGLSKVYSVDKQVPDSAATATAMLTGVKTLNSVIGVDSSVTYDSCKDLTNHKLRGMMHWSQDAGKATGFVTTARVTHATPAALYASTVNRDWESDRDLPWNTAQTCPDIAAQLILNNSDINVIMGGGRRNFLPVSVPDPVTRHVDHQKQRLDGQDLVELWRLDKEKKNASYAIAYTKHDLEETVPIDTDYFFGLFRESHMSYELERNPEIEPSLSDMTRKAIQILQNNNRGYFLMVEGARIDHGHHETKAKKALHDLLAFEQAIATAAEMTREADTLIVVTADHSHTMTISGYPERGNGILDLVHEKGHNLYLATDNLPFTTLNYANGRGHFTPRRNLTKMNTDSVHFRQPSTFPMDSETHSGEDVAIYARGPMAHLLTGVKEQNVIAYVMAHAACVGDTGISCEAGRLGRYPDLSKASAVTLNTIIVAQVMFLSVFVRCW